jgi:hypothetical protein
MTAVNATTATKKDILIEQSSSPISLSSSLERKIAIATEGLTDYVARRLRKIGTRRSQQQDIETICDYIIAMNAEINPSIMYRKNQIVALCYLLEFNYNHHNSNNNYDNNNNQNSFLKMTRNDIYHI